MPTTLQWQVSLRVSYLHVAAAMLDGKRVVDAALAEALAGPVERLGRAIAAADLPRERFLRHLSALAIELENKTQIAETALTKTIGRGRVSQADVAEWTGALSDLENAFCQALPDALDQLAARGEPLKRQWEARGPGLLSALTLQTDERLIVEQADVVLVYPALGGGGVAHLLYNSVRLEAVLADPHTSLPETVRLAWLLARLNLDLPIHSETISGTHLPWIGGLAMIPPVLSAAEEVEWARLDPQTVKLALTAWHLADDHLEELTDMLLDWWKTYRDKRPRWAVALAALEQMVRAAGGLDRGGEIAQDSPP